MSLVKCGGRASRVSPVRRDRQVVGVADQGSQLDEDLRVEVVRVGGLRDQPVALLLRPLRRVEAGPVVLLERLEIAELAEVAKRGTRAGIEPRRRSMARARN